MDQFSKPKQHEFFINEKKCIIYTVQKSKSTWMAYGKYRDKQIQCNGSSDSEVIRKWKHIAEYEASA